MTCQLQARVHSLPVHLFSPFSPSFFFYNSFVQIAASGITLTGELVIGHCAAARVVVFIVVSLGIIALSANMKHPR
jgi:hypothetical protein